jgi:hypothetical protein
MGLPATMVEWPVGSGKQARLLDLCRERGLNLATVKSRLRIGRPLADALKTPPPAMQIVSVPAATAARAAVLPAATGNVANALVRARGIIQLVADLLDAPEALPLRRATLREQCGDWLRDHG